MDFVRTRLTKPNLNSNFIERDRITSVLNRSKSKVLTLVIAGAGYGKSILVSQWLDQIEEKYCWVDLSEDCNDFKIFVEHIIEAVKTVYPDLLEQSQNRINSMEVESHNIISEALINELLNIEDDLYLVFDDYQLIDNKDINLLVEMILKYLSKRIHLVMISRNDPMLNINHLFAYDNVCEIRGKDLQFTDNEISELSDHLYAYKLSTEQVKSVFYNTEGWIIAVRLQLKILSEGVDLSNSNVFHDKQESLMEHMFHEVITVEQDDIFKALILAAFSDRFTIDLIVQMMESDSTNNVFDSKLFRKRFEKTLTNSMFIYSLDYQNKWFRFHRLVRDLLNKKAKQRYSQNQIKKFYIVASRYFYSIHSYEESLNTALFVDDVEFAISIIIGNYGDLLDSEQFQRLGSWLKMLPLGVVENNPELLMIRASLREAVYNLNGLTSDLEILGNIINSVNKDTIEGKRIWGGYYAFSAGRLFLSKEYERALEMSDEALPFLNNDSYVRSYLIIMRSMTLQLLGRGRDASELIDKYLSLIPKENKIGILRSNLSKVIIKSIQGRINKIEFSASLVKEISYEEKKWMTYAMANYYMAAASYFMNKQEEAIKIYKESKKNGFAGRPNFILQTGFFAALQMHSKNDSEGYNQIISELKEYIRNFNKDNFNNLLSAFELEHELLHGNMDKAREHAKQVDFSDYPTVFYFYVPSLTKIKLMLADSDNWDIEETKVELEELIKRKESLHLNHLLIQAYPLLAIWHNRYGDRNESMYYLRKTINLAKEGGFVRIFLDLGEEMHTLIDALDTEEKRTPFVDKILNGFHFNYGRNSIPRKSKEDIGINISNNNHPLVTPREVEVLELLTKGHSNKEIANMLYLSLGTIKTYTYSIYQKINVKNRVEAINKAYEMGITSSNI